MTSKFLALTLIAQLCASGAYAQTTNDSGTQTDATGSMSGTGAMQSYGADWSSSLGSAMFSDTERTTLRMGDDLSMQWQTLSEEDRAMVRRDCTAYQTNATASGGMSDTGTATGTGAASGGTSDQTMNGTAEGGTSDQTMNGTAEGGTSDQTMNGSAEGGTSDTGAPMTSDTSTTAGAGSATGTGTTATTGTDSTMSTDSTGADGTGTAGTTGMGGTTIMVSDAQMKEICASVDMMN